MSQVLFLSTHFDHRFFFSNHISQFLLIFSVIASGTVTYLVSSSLSYLLLFHYLSYLLLFHYHHSNTDYVLSFSLGFVVVCLSWSIALCLCCSWCRSVCRSWCLSVFVACLGGSLVVSLGVLGVSGRSWYLSTFVVCLGRSFVVLLGLWFVVCLRRRMFVVCLGRWWLSWCVTVGRSWCLLVVCGSWCVTVCGSWYFSVFVVCFGLSVVVYLYSSSICNNILSYQFRDNNWNEHTSTVLSHLTSYNQHLVEELIYNKVQLEDINNRPRPY